MDAPMPAAGRLDDVALARLPALGGRPGRLAADGSAEAREAFHQVLGETIFRMALKEMRRLVGGGGLFTSGGAAAIIAGQMDECLAERVARAQPPEFSRRYF